MLKYIGVAVALVAIALVIMAAARPSSFHVERSITIAAAPEKIDALVADFHNWDQWSPWAKLDPSMRQSFSGAAAGPGAVYEWQGNSKVGKGRMQILAVQPSLTSIQLDFLSPFKSHNKTNFIVQPQGGATRVTWTMDGNNNFTSQVMSLFVSMDRMIGGDFERGLANLKTAAER
jgi:hypothetical protein